MLMIRLQRVGRKNDPNFRIVVCDSRKAPKSGAFLEILGYVNPKNKKIELKSDRIKSWILKGAQLSSRVHNMCVDAKIIESKKINVVPPVKIEERPEEVKTEPKPVEPAKIESKPPEDERKEGVDKK